MPRLLGCTSPRFLVSVRNKLRLSLPIRSWTLAPVSALIRGSLTSSGGATSTLSWSCELFHSHWSARLKSSWLCTQGHLRYLSPRLEVTLCRTTILNDSNTSSPTLPQKSCKCSWWWSADKSANISDMAICHYAKYICPVYFDQPRVTFRPSSLNLLGLDSWMPFIRQSTPPGIHCSAGVCFRSDLVPPKLPCPHCSVVSTSLLAHNSSQQRMRPSNQVFFVIRLIWSHILANWPVQVKHPASTLLQKLCWDICPVQTPLGCKPRYKKST